MAEQVHDLTYNKQCYEKEFIDFSFAGKHVSEFGWVAVTDGDRLSLKGSAPFEDITSEINGVDGQYYWGSRYKPLEASYSLATDGVTEAELMAFKRHFQPGRYGKLENCEHIGRWAWARVSQQVEITVIPFKQNTSIVRQGKTIHTNLYKGEATITFIIDYPFWQIEGALLSHNYSALTALEEFERMQSNVLPADTKTHIGSTEEEPYQDITDIFIGNGASCTLSSAPTYYYNPSIINTPPTVALTLTNSTGAASGSINYITTFGDGINGYNYKRLMSYIPAVENQSTEVILSMHRFTSPSFHYNINRAIQIINAMNATGVSLDDFEETMREEILDFDLMNEIAKFIKMCRAISATTASKPVSWTDYTPPAVTIGTIDTWASGWQAAWTTYLNSLLISGSTTTVVFNSKDSTTRVSYAYNSLVAPVENVQIESTDNSDTTTSNDPPPAWTLTTITVSGKNSGETALSKYLYLEGGDTVTIESQTDEDTQITTLVPVIAPEHAIKLCGSTTTTGMAASATLSYNYLYV